MINNAGIARIYGTGMIAKALNSVEKIEGCYFAAGVSNSNCNDEREYKREIIALDNFIHSIGCRRVVYYSSFVAIAGAGRYADHKRHIENHIQSKCENFLIIRLPQVVGITNNNTLVSYFTKNIIKKESVNIQRNAFRRIIDVSDVVRISKIMYESTKENKIINVAPLVCMRSLDIFIEISNILGINSAYNIIDGGFEQIGDLEDSLNILGRDEKIFSPEYQIEVLKKYVPTLAHQIS